MRNVALFVLGLCAMALASGGDTLTYPSALRTVADGDTFFVSRHIAPLRDSVQSIINGRLGNVNLASDAAIEHDKIDSTDTGWLYRYTKKITKWAGELLSFRSARGINVFVNDTTANTQAFNIISDSTDTIAKFYEDSIVLKKEINAGAVSGNFLNLNTGQGDYELYAMNQNVRTTDGPTFATVNTGQGANELYAMNQNVLTTSDVAFGSIAAAGNTTLGNVSTSGSLDVSGNATLGNASAD